MTEEKPSTLRAQRILTSSIENRTVVSQIEKREWVSAIDVREERVSKSSSELNPVDPTSGHSVKSSKSRGKALVKKTASLKNAFLLGEILRRVVD